MVKIIGICGSPRKGGNSEILLKEALKGAEEVGAETEIIFLREKKIEMCDGCCECDTTKKCHLQDDMEEIIKKLIDTDCVIFSVPTYFDNVNGLTKNFLDRLNPVGVDRELKNKYVGIIAVGATKEKSFKKAIEAIKIFSEIELMKFVDSSWGKAYKIGEIANDKEAITNANELGKKIVNVYKMEV